MKSPDFPFVLSLRIFWTRSPPGTKFNVELLFWPLFRYALLFPLLAKSATVVIPITTGRKGVLTKENTIVKKNPVKQTITEDINVIDNKIIEKKSIDMSIPFLSSIGIILLLFLRS